MSINFKSNSLYIGLASALIVLAYFIQSACVLSGDAGSLLYDTKLMLSGGTYVRDFFETNPPMIFYLYTPVVLAAKLTTFSLANIFRVYVCALIFISATCCVYLLKKIFAKKEEAILYFGFICVLFFILLFLPGREFGQREHFFMMLFFPYLFAAVLRFDRSRISPLFAIFIGLMAGLGVGLKPYFLFPIVLIELYFILSKRSIFAWVRVESIICIMVLAVYLSSIFIFHSEYIHILLPMISDLYFISTKESWTIIFGRPCVIYCCIVWLYFFVCNCKPQKTLITILMLALTGMLAAFIVPRSAWYYHVLPAFGLACLLALIYSALLIRAQLKNKLLSKIDRALFMFAGLLVFVPPLTYAVMSTEIAIFQKKDEDAQLLRSYIRALSEPKKIYCFSANTTIDCFPLVDDTKSEFSGRFPFFWWLRGLIKMEENPLSDSIEKDKQFLMTAMIDDLNHYQPTLVIINRHVEDCIFGKDFDYIVYFSRDEKFRKAWRHYRYAKTIGDYQVYKRL